MYIISTPIGNKDDITIRALTTIRDMDYIFCEDTRYTNKLLEQHGIKKSLFVYNDFSSDKERQKIIKLLLENKKVGLVSDAGTPLISDPGYKLVKECRKHNIKTYAICGASAVLVSLVVSGMPTDKFLFYGFVEKKELEQLKYRNETVILYESPKRILFLLQDILSIIGNIEVCVCRELTKIHEEVKNGSCSEILEYFKNNPQNIKGEFVILLKNNLEKTSFDKEKVLYANSVLSEFLKPKEIADFIVKIGIAGNKKEVYNLINLIQ